MKLITSQEKGQEGMVYYKPYNFRIEKDPDASKALTVGAAITGGIIVVASYFFAPQLIPKEIEVFTGAAAASFVEPMIIPDSSNNKTTIEGNTQA